jgi:hypothetical protein
MNTEESEQDLQRRLQELEASIPSNAHPVTTQANTSNEAAGLNKIANLFKSLPTTGKLIAVGVGVIVGFAILKSLLSLLAALFSLAFLGVVGYFTYQFLIARSSQK